MRVDKSGWLEELAEGFPALTKVPSVRTTALDTGAGEQVRGIVWHWTGGAPGGSQFAPALAEEIRTYKPGDRQASWHVLVARDGRIIQSVPFTKGSWHVGKPGLIAGRQFGNINRATVGVELENAGRLEQLSGKFYRWPFWLDPDHHDGGPDPKYEVKPERAVPHGGQFFDAFPEAQEQAATRLLHALVLAYKWPREVCMYGHRDFDPARKEDPGPLWQDVVLPRILTRIFGA